MKVKKYRLATTIHNAVILTSIGLIGIPFVLPKQFTAQFGIAKANTVSNGNFQIEIEEVADQPEEQLPQPIEELPAEKLQSPHGIAFIPSPFAFSVTEPLIDFGLLTATNPVIRTSTLTIASPGNGYHVLAFTNHPLRSSTNISIPDTTCDNGACSEVTASLWENNLTYGFGYRCDTNTKGICSDGFEDKTAYKQLSDRSKKETPLPIMHNQARTENDEVKITYKVNVSGTQQKEIYTHTITLIAVPNF